MTASGEYFVAGQPLKLKASTPSAALSEALEYLVQNTFNKMSYLKHLSGEPLKELQAILRSNDTAKETALLRAGENNPEAIEDLRTYLQLCAMKSQQVVLHEMLEKRYSLRPYGWPEDEVLLLLARLIVLGEANLMMDASLLPIDKVYEAITTPAKRRKIVVRKRETADPKSIQDARSLGKELFAEMGPDGEEALFTNLQAKLKEWQVALNGYRQLVDTGNYPGGTEIGEALTLIGPLLADTDSRKFVERFNGLKSDLLEVAEQFHELDHFYNHQKPAWERLYKSHTAFQLNRLELGKWLATYPNSALRAQMEYYIEPAEQTVEVAGQVKVITPSSLDPEALTMLDPACGSCHILVEGYDLFKAIYLERGYRLRDIPALILRKNLFGLEIDDRAAQLGAFALMMKARADDRRIFDTEARPNVQSFQESNGIDAAAIAGVLNSPVRIK